MKLGLLWYLVKRAFAEAYWSYWLDGKSYVNPRGFVNTDGPINIHGGYVCDGGHSNTIMTMRPDMVAVYVKMGHWVERDQNGT